MNIKNITLVLLSASCFLASSLLNAATETINLLNFKSNKVPEEFYKPKHVEKLPIPIAEIIKMKKGGLNEEVIQDAIEKRKVIGGSDAESLLALKKVGLGKDVIKAVSRYSLPENRSLDIEFTIEFKDPSTSADPRYLYVLFEDGEYDRIFYIDLEKALQGKWLYDETTDLSDPVLKKKIRTIRFFGSVTMKKHGKKQAKVILSKKSEITAVSEFGKDDLGKATKLDFNYPAYSLFNDCQLKINFKRDVVLKDKYEMISANMNCEFE